jgi:hypothetical protein
MVVPSPAWQVLELDSVKGCAVPSLALQLFFNLFCLSLLGWSYSSLSLETECSTLSNETFIYSYGFMK